jgi:hypothetical protein
VTASSGEATEQVNVRVSPEIYAALQLAQPFVQRRSMQELLKEIIEDFVASLRARDPGYEKALLGLRESEARKSGVLARRTTSGGNRPNQSQI